MSVFFEQKNFSTWSHLPFRSILIKSWSCRYIENLTLSYQLYARSKGELAPATKTLKSCLIPGRIKTKCVKLVSTAKALLDIQRKGNSVDEGVIRKKL